MCLSAGSIPVPVWDDKTGQWTSSQGQQYMRVTLDSGATSGVGFGSPMGWNYETGREEVNAYVGNSPFTPAPPKYYKKGCVEILRWEELEAAWRRDRNWRSQWTVPGLLQAWEAAEMALISWDKRSQVENFRRGYIEWLATQDGVADSLSDLEIEQLPLIDRIIARGYRELSKTEHPDVGGTTERFAKLREAKRQLDRVMSEVGDLLKESE